MVRSYRRDLIFCSGITDGILLSSTGSDFKSGAKAGRLMALHHSQDMPTAKNQRLVLVFCWRVFFLLLTREKKIFCALDVVFLYFYVMLITKLLNDLCFHRIDHVVKRLFPIFYSCSFVLSLEVFALLTIALSFKRLML